MPTQGNQSQDDLVVGFSSNKSWLALLIFVDLVAFFGNLLTIYGILSSRRFRSSSHYLIVSLSVSDLITAMVVMPLGILNAVTGEWRSGRVLCHFWFVVNLTCCSASVLNLAVISLDRYWCILKPLRYTRLQGSNLCFIVISVIWCEAFFTACLPVLGWETFHGRHEANVCIIEWLLPSYFYVFVLVLNLLCPFLVMLYVYACIYLTARRQRHQISMLFSQHNQSAMSRSFVKPNKASGRLAVLLGVFLVCWIPYLLVTLYLQFCSLCRIHQFVVDIVTWLAWSNSCFNPVLYGWFNREYRLMYKKMLKCHSLRRERIIT